MIIDRLIKPEHIPLKIFSTDFRQHHKRLCKYCELAAGILVGYETHLVMLTMVCGVWVVIDAMQILMDLE